jgi:hypothetical protein
MAKKKKTSPDKTGYRQFMSGFAKYARENNIHIHGGRGSFAKKASEVWKDLKGKPAWESNLDVILPPYLEGIEGVPSVEPNFRLKAVIQEFATQQYQWWEIKNLYGLWSESINILPDKDRLLIEGDEDEGLIQLKADLDAFSLYNAYRDLSENNSIDAYSYLTFKDATLNDIKGIDVTFSFKSSKEYMTVIHSKTTFDWSQKAKEQYGMQKEAVGKEGAAKIARTRVNIKSAARREAQEITRPQDLAKTKASIRKLDELNKAINKLEKQYDKGLITKKQYRSYLNKLYKL